MALGGEGILSGSGKRQVVLPCYVGKERIFSECFAEKCRDVIVLKSNVLCRIQHVSILKVVGVTCEIVFDATTEH